MICINTYKKDKIKVLATSCNCAFIVSKCISEGEDVASPEYWREEKSATSLECSPTNQNFFTTSGINVIFII